LAGRREAAMTPAVRLKFSKCSALGWFDSPMRAAVCEALNSSSVKCGLTTVAGMVTPVAVGGSDIRRASDWQLADRAEL
jgi:hypothetical protein